MKKVLSLFVVLCTIGITNLFAQTYNGGVWYSLYDNAEHSKSTTTGVNNNITICSHGVFTPSTGVLSFNTRMTKAGLINPQSYQILVGDQTVDVADKQTSFITKTTNVSTSLSALDFKLKYKAYNSGRTIYITNVQLPLAQHILLADGQGSKTFDNVVVDGASAGQKVSLRSFLTNGNITIKSSDNAFRINSTSNLSGLTYAVGANACASANGSGAAGGSNLGAISQYDFTVYFCPTEAKEYSATITITDGTSTATVSVSGVGVKKTQQLTWAADFQADEVALPVGKEIVNPAITNSGLALIYTSNDETILAVEGTTIKALKAGEATLTVEQAGDDEWNAISATKTIKVTEKTIQYIHWIDNLTRLVVGGEPIQLTATAQILINAETEETQEAPERTALITYASADASVVAVEGNMLTIVGEGETTLTATLPGDDTYEAATVTMPVRVRVPSLVCETYLLNAPDEVKFQASGNSYEPAELVGPAYQLTFEARIGNATAVGDLHVQQMVNGEWQDMDDFMPKTDWQVYGPYTLDRNATKVRFYSPYGSFNRFIKNVLVTQATYLETTTPEITVEKSIIGDNIIQTIAVQYSNLPEGVMITNTSDIIQLSDHELGTECGTYGEKLITLTATPTALGTVEDVITIKDDATGLALNIPVTIHTQRNTQAIIWEDSIATIYATDTVILYATAQTDVYYTSSDSAIAYVNEANQLLVQSLGTVTITAHAVESETYEPAELSKEITIVATPPVVTALPTVEPLGYGVELTNDLLVGGEANVEGTFVWNLNPEQELIPGEYDLPIQFLPANSNLYGVLDLTVHVVINKGEQTITWNDDLSGLTTNDTVYLTATAITEVYYEVSDPAIATVNGNQLTFLTAGEVTISAFAEEDEYYNMAILEKTIYVNAGLDESIVIAYPTATSITYGQILGDSQLEGGQAEVEGEFVWADGGLLLSAGKHVMPVLFVPIEQELYANVELYVEVEVLPAEQTITWELNVPVVMLLGETMSLTATASSYLPISYTMDKEGIVSVENDVVTAIAVGSVTITANQEGVDEDGFQNFMPAEPVSYIVQVLAEDIEMGVDNVSTNGNARKIIRNGQMYIIRGEQTYDAHGNLIR